MDPAKINIYGPCDEAIRTMDRDILRSFGQLKLSRWDEVNIIQSVRETYQRSIRKAKRRYYEVAFEACVLALIGYCGMEPKKAHRTAEKLITREGVEDALEEVDPVTRYRFTEEAERKMYRLAESLEIEKNRDAEIEKAIRYWSRQAGWYAVAITDFAVMLAMKEAGVDLARWVTMEDEKVCEECRARDGKVYPLADFPAKPHLGCRCRRVPANGAKV